MRLVELEQGTPAWKRWRAGGLGGSDAPAVIGLCRYRSPAELWRSKCKAIDELVGEPDSPDASGRVDEAAESAAMARGRRLEPIARARYAERMRLEAGPICAEHEEHLFLRVSLDGWAADAGIPVELKAPRRSDHEEALGGRIPIHYVPQCLHILLVTGAPYVHYASFSPDSFRARKQLAMVRLHRDDTAMRNLLEAERAFWGRVVERAEPPSPPRIDFSRLAMERVSGPESHLRGDAVQLPLSLTSPVPPA